MVRWEVEPLDKPSRTLTQHVAVHLPWLSHSLSGAPMRRPAGSRFRRRVLTLAVQLAWEAANRHDWEALYVGYSPDVEMRFDDSEHSVPDMREVYRGHAGVREVIETWQAGFAKHRFEPREIFDPGGERFGGSVEMVGSGSASGVEVRQMRWQLWWVRGGVVVRQIDFWQEQAFLEALAD